MRSRPSRADGLGPAGLREPLAETAKQRAARPGPRRGRGPSEVPARRPAGGLDRGRAAQEFAVVAERQDAWTWSREPIGRVFLIRTGKDQVKAFRSSVPMRAARSSSIRTRGRFACTCHTHPRFDLAGRRLDEHSGSPRDLDELAVKIGPRGEVLVRYETFRTGTAEKIAVP